MLIGYTVFCIGNSMFASKKDLEGAFTLMIFFLIAFSLAYFLGIRIHITNFGFIFSERVTPLFIIANKFHALGAAMSVNKPVILLDPFNEEITNMESEILKAQKNILSNF